VARCYRSRSRRGNGRGQVFAGYLAAHPGKVSRMYIGGGILVIILIILVVVLLMRR
jgi:hypothetical protein